MPIEFRCSQCGRLLRTPDDSAGRQARCPECGQVQQVPSPNLPPQPEPIPPAAPSPEGTNPFGGPSVAGANPFAGPAFPGPAVEPENPYQAPQYGTGATYEPQYVAGRLLGPAIALIITAVLGILGDLFGLFQIALVFGSMKHQNPQMALGFLIWLVAFLLFLFLNSLIIFGSWRMAKRKSYALAMIAAILAMIPCLSPCYLLGIPFGIWAFVVLLNEHVKAAFQR